MTRINPTRPPAQPAIEKTERFDYGEEVSPEEHLAWVRAKVARSLANPAPSIPHDEVMRKAQRIIDDRIEALGKSNLDKPRR